MKFNDKYEKIRQLCQEQITQIEELIISSLDIREDMRLYLIKFLKLPSKHIRLVLSILYMKLTGLKISDDILKILAAVELVHNASLIHDDIIDESVVRRGEKTLSCTFGNKLGVICGDYLLSVAMALLGELNSPEIIKIFITTLKNMCIGEVNQYYDKYKIGTIEEYVEKSKNKTAYLFQTALVCPFIFAGKSAEEISKASDFGLNFGIAFQMRDDILNLISSDKTKPSKNDITDGIYTASVIYAQDSVNYMKGVEKAHCLMNNYIGFAAEIIESFEDNPYKIALKDLLELVKHE